MSAIFISHATEDRAAAEHLCARLHEAGFESLFVDFSERKGIGAGVDWEREIYRKLRSCRCLIALCTQTSLRSRWCFAELTHARALGKSIFPVRLDDSALEGLLDAQQAVDLRPGADEAAGYRRLYAGLNKAGILQNAWDSGRSPYPGLMAFEEEDAPVFFGRETAVEDGLSRLAVLPSRGPKWLLLLGTSGCGKSSVLRAGLLPRIRLDNEHWLPVGPVRLGPGGMERLVRAFASAFAAHGKELDWRLLRERLSADSPTSWSDLAGDLRAAAGRPEANLLLIVDQFEELLLADTQSHAERAATHRLLRALRGLSELENMPCFVLATLRSDFLGSFQQHPALRGLESDELVVKPLACEALARVITGPAELAGIAIEAGLADQLVRDTETEAALPLLAFSLRELYERRKRTGLLELRTYCDELGGLQRSVAIVAEDVLSAERLRLPAAKLHLLRAALLSLVRLSNDGIPARRRVRWADLPADMHPSLDAFVRARLLVARGDGLERELEVAHEALFHAWPELGRWLAESRAFLAWRSQIDPLVLRWQETKRQRRSLLSGPELAEARGWMRREPLLLGEAERAFITASRAAERTRNLVLGSGLIVVVATLASTTAWALSNSAEAGRQRTRAEAEEKHTQGLLASSYLEQGRQAVLEGRLEQALPFVVAARELGLNGAPAAQLFASALRNGHWTTTVRHADSVQEASFSPDGSRLLTASSDKTARLWDAITGALLARFGHHDAVNGAAFSPDGLRVLTASDDGTARIWNADSGKQLVPPLQHAGWVLSAAFSVDGTRVVTASADGSARVWNADTGAPLGDPLRHRGWVLRATFSRDGTRVVTASADRTARLWSVTGQPLAELQHGDTVNAATFSFDGTHVVTASDDHTAGLWDANTGKPLAPLLRHQGAVLSAAFSPDGSRLVTASADGTAGLWGAADGRPLTPALQHGDAVHAAVFSPDGARVLTASADMTLRLWDAVTGKPLTPVLRHRDVVNGAVFRRDGARILSASDDGSARVWDVAADALPARILKHDSAVTGAVFDVDGTRILTACDDRAAHLWNVRTGAPLAQPLQHRDVVKSAVFSRDGARVLTVSADTTARVWDATTGEPVTPPLQHQGEVHSGVFSPDDSRILTASSDMTARLWDAASGRELAPRLEHRGAARSAVFSRDGARILTASSDGTARLWDATTGKPVISPMQHRDAVKSAVFSPDETRILTASSDMTAQLWSALTGKPIGAPLQHRDAVKLAIFSPDGTRVLTASLDKTARLWDAETGQPLTAPLEHRGAVMSVAFSADGSLVLSTSSDGSARVWDAATGKPLTLPLQHGGPVYSAVFARQGDRVLSASGDGTARIWDVPQDERTLAQWHDVVTRCSDFVLEAGVLSPNPLSSSTCPASLLTPCEALPCP
jgi:WD40 repeat protein